MVERTDPLRPALKQHFGYDSFRPLQEEIIREVLAGKDVFALLPTGAGKSLCYQLPACVTAGLTVVVSPLIALMKDQVDALSQAGVAATFLNSSLLWEDARERRRGLAAGAYRILYVAPEKLLAPDFLDDLSTWRAARFAIDEAHCISEWGHDFRPEYRGFSRLRERFPDLPVLALTATATVRVRADIVQSLRLRTPTLFVASFNRPNLRYRVVARADPMAQLLEVVRTHRDGSGIVYCQSRRAAEAVADGLRSAGVAALPYHAGLPADERARNQEQFVRDDVQVMCATIAFGMGVHKPDVRFVVHWDLPKSVEGYYQETGRAGRDGLASDCVLLFGAGDVAKHRRFLEEKTDPAEREQAFRQLQQIVAYAESPTCRRQILLAHFGEEWPANECAACDNCQSPRESYDGTLLAQKLLSCVYRIRERSGFDTGLGHVVEVLTGADTEKVRRWGHDGLSTYGIGKERSRPEWRAIGRELVRLGLLRQSEDAFATVALAARGRAALSERSPIELTRSLLPERSARSERSERGAAARGEIACDEVLFGKLRQMRRELASERKIPPFMVFSDVSLRTMARDCPRTLAEFGRVHGVGARKLAEFGEVFLAAIREHLGLSHSMNPVEAAAQKPQYEDRLQRFQNLMPRRVRQLLLVASSYDSFLLAEDGQLDDLILNEFFDPNLRDRPWITRISEGEDALAVLAGGKGRFDLVVATPHIRNMDVLDFARKVKERNPSIPVVVLAFDARELAALRTRGNLGDVERLFVWQGDYRILLGIVKALEDRWNVRADTEKVGVSSIILIEDSVRYYSSFLPTIYSELLKQSQRVIAEGMNLTNKVMRMRARPKILHCISYEEAISYFEKYRRTLLGIISDVDFPKNGQPHAASGLDFARMVREVEPELPIMLQTRDPAYADKAKEAGIAILLKDSPFLLEQLGRFIRDSFGFGDFVFQRPDRTEVGRARDLRELEAMLHTVSDDSLLYHAERNHFSTWLRARTEFSLAEALRPRRVSEFSSVAELRRYLVEAIREFCRERQSGVISAFDPETFEAETSFARIGGGSLGGKARGLAFVRQLLYENQLRSRFADVRVFVPSAVVLATDVFDQFLDDNVLRDFAIQAEDDSEIERRFLEARFPEQVFASLLHYLDLVQTPLAVRSSSLLEDSQHLPFTGIYRTYMVPNSHPEKKVRVKELVNAIKRVYASTFFRRAKEYVRPTPFRLEQEKMAVILQRLVGVRHGPRFYPDFAGVARSYNFYPTPPMVAADGIVSVALGLGETVVSGGKTVRFAPRYPTHPVAFSSPEEILRNAQPDFHALILEEAESTSDPAAELRLGRFEIETAVEDGTFAQVGSIYSHENDAVYDGAGRRGVPVVTFAPILKQRLFPLAEVTSHLLEVGSLALNASVEIEFAANVAAGPGAAGEFAVLQVRPFATGSDTEVVALGAARDEELLCRSDRVLGNGVIDGILDVVVVDRDRFERSRSVEVASQVARMNERLVDDELPFALIGVGRWGAADPWLGIPVTWEQIAGARVIVESTFRDLDVAPSQGSHFFQNLTASLVGYFTVGSDRSLGFVDWEWLAAQAAVAETPFVRHLRLAEPIEVRMDGRAGKGVIVKRKASGGTGGSGGTAR